MRVYGQVEFVTNTAILKRAQHAKQYLENIGEQSTEPYLNVFKLAHGEAKFWDLKTNILRQPEETHLSF